MEFLVDFFWFMINALLIGTTVFVIFTWVVANRLESQIKSVMQDLEEDRLIPLTVEVDQDQYFCYNSVTKAFVCQGFNLKEIVDRFKLRYPNASAAIYDGDERAVKVLKAQMKELSENSNRI
jgi:3'-phosphoadenosine 5'-phosphosulfate sulfotransferase